MCEPRNEADSCTYCARAYPSDNCEAFCFGSHVVRASEVRIRSGLRVKSSVPFDTLEVGYVLKQSFEVIVLLLSLTVEAETSRMTSYRKLREALAE